jgi:hypothetical protein
MVLIADGRPSLHILLNIFWLCLDHIFIIEDVVVVKRVF